MPPKNNEAVDRIFQYCQGLDNDELDFLLGRLREEETRRERQRKEEDWNVVRNAIADYIERWGTISVYDDEHSVDITYRSDFGSIGEIDATY